MIRNWLPKPVARRLWGDRERWGLEVRRDDPSWVEWIEVTSHFYEANQREGVGIRINDAGYRVMADVDLAGKTVLEIGAGDIRHDRHWNGKQPAEYLLADVDAAMLDRSVQRLSEIGVLHRGLLMERGQALPLADASVDVIVSFYSMEHLYPLRPYLEEMRRVLKPGGALVGAIPAEGGLAWGLGRYLTSRRWFLANTTIDPDKIICWEHPNFADQVVTELDTMFTRRALGRWPFPWLPVLDCNLILKFRYER